MSSINFAQNKILIDSLLKEVQKTKNDSLLALVYNEISGEYWSDNPAECKRFAQLSLNAARKVRSHILISDAYLNLGAAESFIGNINDALKYSRLAYKEAELSKDLKKIMGACVNLGSDYVSVSKFDSANIILDRGIKIAKKIKDHSQLGSFYINKGNCLYSLSQVDSAEYYFEAGLKNAISLNDTNTMVMLYNNIASIRLNRGISDSTVIVYMMKAISFNEKRKDWINLGDNYATIAAAYSIRNNKNKTIFYLKKGIASFAKLHNETKSLNLLVSLADQYREMNMIDSAGYYAEKAIKAGERNNYTHGLAAAYCIKGIILSNRSEYGNAEKYLLRSYNEFHDSQFGEGIFLAGNYLVNVYIRQKRNNEALKIATKLFRMADSLKNFVEIKKSSLALSNIYHQSGNDTKAYEYLNHYLVASDTIEKLNNATLLADMEAKYETQKKDYEILKLNNEKLIKDQKISQQTKWIFLIAFLAILLSLFYYFYNRQVKYKNEKAHYELKQQINEAKQETLNAQMSTHFISRTMDSINNFIRNNEKDKASEYLLLFNRLIRRVLENSFKNAIPISEDIAILEDYIKLEKLRFVEEPLEYKINIDKEIDISNTLIPPMVFQTLAENSIVHGFTKSSGGVILLSINKVNETIECVIEDNGIGRKKSFEQKAETEKHKTSLGSGLAEKLVKLFSEAGRDTEFRIIDSLSFPAGTRVEFAIPLINNVDQA
jgi:cbb3-type cytochrome oxidase subunit 3